MYIVLCARIVKVNTGATAQFAPRTANREQPSAIGPFATRRAAAAAAMKAAGTHTCLSAVVCSADGAERMLKGYLYLSDSVMAPVRECIRQARESAAIAPQ